MESPIPLQELGQAASAARNEGVVQKVQRLGRDADAQTIRAAAEEFEAVFLSTMLAPMFEGLGDDPMFGGGPGEDMYRSLMVEEYGKSVARAGGLGIADAVERELLRLQDVAR